MNESSEHKPCLLIHEAVNLTKNNSKLHFYMFLSATKVTKPLQNNTKYVQHKSSIAIIENIILYIYFS